ncbi:MAG: transposase [Betaproteobacteria bacterium HGW-Betaproteobacteria-18]|nr:MAG: transposase [Betaproteobacteria bacterium HGW-Betaproteobacteria-18]
MSYDDLLTGRYSSPGQVYFVTTVTVGRAPIFDDFKSARCVIREMQQAHTSGRVNSLAWVLMPDHLHWLFQLGDVDVLAQVMQSFKGRSARALNAMNLGKRSVWQNGYHDHALRKEEDVRGVARYLAANPLRAGLVAQIGDYSHWDAAWL